jgi:hypothetical protein
MKSEKKKENTNTTTLSSSATESSRDVMIRLLVHLLEHNIRYVSAPDPHLQLGTPPRGGRKLAAMVINPTQCIINLLWIHEDIIYWIQECVPSLPTSVQTTQSQFTRTRNWAHWIGHIHIHL